jgi:hypothetical protein
MKETPNRAFITVEPERRHGMVVVGSYLGEALRQLGVYTQKHEEDEEPFQPIVVVKRGGGLLSPLTKTEIKELGKPAGGKEKRIAAQAKIIEAGELVIEVMPKTDPRTEQEKLYDDFRKDFAALPLEQKAARLVELEVMAFGETFANVLNLPFTIGDKVVEMMAQFGWEIDKKEQEAKRPEEHKKAPEKEKAKKTAKEGGAKKTKRSAPKRKTKQGPPIVEQ